MSLSNASVLSVLKNQYICGYKNITGASYAGRSGKHDPAAPAVVTTNGAGPHNVQMFFLSPEGNVLHCLLGYWAPNDLLVEIRLVDVRCKATVGEVGNAEHELVSWGKAGRNRWRGKRPSVRGVAMNPVDTRWVVGKASPAVAAIRRARGARRRGGPASPSPRTSRSSAGRRSEEEGSRPCHVRSRRDRSSTTI